MSDSLTPESIVFEWAAKHGIKTHRGELVDAITAYDKQRAEAASSFLRDPVIASYRLGRSEAFVEAAAKMRNQADIYSQLAGVFLLDRPEESADYSCKALRCLDIASWLESQAATP